jgi:hypothetical protein
MQVIFIYSTPPLPMDIPKEYTKAVAEWIEKFDSLPKPKNKSTTNEVQIKLRMFNSRTNIKLYRPRPLTRHDATDVELIVANEYKTLAEEIWLRLVYLHRVKRWWTILKT